MIPIKGPKRIAKLPTPIGGDDVPSEPSTLISVSVAELIAVVDDGNSSGGANSPTIYWPGLTVLRGEA
jgi:hypothetical protein